MTFEKLEDKIDLELYKHGEGKIITADKGIKFYHDAEIRRVGEVVEIKTDGKITSILLKDIIDVL